MAQSAAPESGLGWMSESGARGAVQRSCSIRDRLPAPGEGGRVPGDAGDGGGGRRRRRGDR